MWNSAAMDASVFSRSSSFRSGRGSDDDEEALRWAALERLPTFSRVRRGLFKKSTGDVSEVDVTGLSSGDRTALLDRLLGVTGDSEEFFRRIRRRFDVWVHFDLSKVFFWAGIWLKALILRLIVVCVVLLIHLFCRVHLEFPKIEVRFQNLKVDAYVHVGSRALPTIPNFIFNMSEVE